MWVHFCKAVSVRSIVIAVALTMLLAAGSGCVGDPYEHTTETGVHIDTAVSNYKDACSAARGCASNVGPNLLLSMFDVEYVGQQNISDRHGKYTYTLGKVDDNQAEGYEVEVVLDLQKHVMDKMTITHGDLKAVDAPDNDLDVSAWIITEDDIFECIYADVGRSTIEKFKSPVVSWGGRYGGEADGGPLVIAQCYDESNYRATLHSYFLDPRTGKRIPDRWRTDW